MLAPVAGFVYEVIGFFTGDIGSGYWNACWYDGLSRMALTALSAVERKANKNIARAKKSMMSVVGKEVRVQHAELTKMVNQ